MIHYLEQAKKGAKARPDHSFIDQSVFVERLWRSLKYEEIYLKAYENAAEARQGIAAYFEFYNHQRLHQALAYRTPRQVFDEAPRLPVRRGGKTLARAQHCQHNDMQTRTGFFTLKSADRCLEDRVRYSVLQYHICDPGCARNLMRVRGKSCTRRLRHGALAQTVRLAPPRNQHNYLHAQFVRLRTRGPQKQSSQWPPQSFPSPIIRCAINCRFPILEHSFYARRPGANDAEPGAPN